MIDKPKHLYKYTSASRAVQIIRDLTFYYAPVKQLNDLFDFRVKSLFTETPDSKYQVYAKRLLVDGWFSDEDDAIAAAKTMGKDEVESTYEYFLAKLMPELEKIMNHSGVTCFSSERNNQRMWGTYGDNHTGICIEYDASNDSSNISNYLMPVHYTSHKIPFCPSEIMNDKLSIDLRLINVFLCIKHNDWKEEREWRLLLIADSEQSTKERIIPFDRSAISRIFLGPRISEEHEKEIRKVASKHNPPIPIFKRVIDPTEAKEEHVGMEQIHSFDQLLYWAKHVRPNPDKDEDDDTPASK